MRTVNFIIGFHSHQPVGNFDYVIEDAVKRCYKPLIETLYKFQDVKVCLHFSGILYEYFDEKHPYLMDNLKEMAERGQVEFMSGGFYEPILPIIPEEDAVQQIMMMNRFIQERFNQTPQGIWLTERVWEPHLPVLLSKAGIKYSVVDDSHLLAGGVPKDRIFNFFITEHDGERVYIFPISKDLRYLIPFRDIEETLNFLKNIPGNLAVIADDGEKFGVWPGTYRRVYEDGYLKAFFSRIKDTEWINTLTFSEAIKVLKPEGPVYMPTASYSEMMEWVLPTDDRVEFEELSKTADEKVRKFLKGGFFRNFFYKYPEGNHMHKRMIMVSNELKGKGINEKIDLFKAQCNCAYWHGIFGGLYLPHLRQAIYRHLIMAERGNVQNGVTIEDIDFDGSEEVIVRTGEYNLIIHVIGGKIVEFDLKDPPYNLMNVMTRRREAYHRFLGMKGEFDGKKTIHEVVTAKEENLEKFLKYDPVRLGMFGDIIGGGEILFSPKIDGNAISLESPVYIKKFVIENRGFSVEWVRKENLPEMILIPIATYTDRIDFSNEYINIEDQYEKIGIQMGLSGIERVEMEDIYTITSSESGMEKTKQGILFRVYPEISGTIKITVEVK